jgi:diguanylate cyclase (GGDEF)-like protein/PAS domain S-box-containing protein
MNRGRWWALAVVAAAGLPAYLLLTPGTPQQAVFYAYGVAAVVALLTGVTRNHPRHRGPWLAFAAGLALFTFGDVAYDTMPSDGPGPADALYLAGYVVLAAGALQLVRRRTPKGDLLSVIDGVMVALGVGAVSWTVLGESFDGRGLDLLEQLVPIAYPALDLLLLAVLVRLVLGGGARNPSFVLLASSLLALITADIAYGMLDVTGNYQSGDLVDLGWMASYVLWGAAALHRSMCHLTEPADSPERPRSRGFLAVLALTAIAAPLTLVVQDLRGAETDVVVLATVSMVLFALVLVRVRLLTQHIERVAAQQAQLASLSEAEQRNARLFRSVVQHSSDIITLLGPGGVVAYASPAVELLLGRAPETVVGTVYTHLIHPDDVDAVRNQAMFILEGGLRTSVRTECRVSHTDGTWRDTEIVVTNLLDDPDVAAVVVNARDVTVRKQLENELNRQAFSDTLTGLANRALFTDRVAHALSRAERGTDPLAVLFVDLDDFKVVNDGLGHPVGDRLLVEVAARLGRATRPGDTVARLGGDEFCILLESGLMPDVAQHVADRIVEVLRAPFRIDGAELTVSASIGIALGYNGRNQPDELLRNADLAMYMAKRNGKGRSVVFEPEMYEQAMRRLEVAADLRRGLEDRQLEVFYQPIVSMATGTAIGVEALVRWRHPQRGLVAPVDFVPVAESTGLIVGLGRQVLEQACRDVAAWRRAGLVDDHFDVSVNLSARQLLDPQLVADVLATLDGTGLPASNLVLEVTESVLIDDLEASIVRLHTLKHLGVRLAIDDFGTGYSSLSYLHTLPVDVVKIDKSFIDRLDGGHEGRAVVSTIIELAHALGLTSTAEGVEETDQLEVLRQLGCDTVQGYLFARPMSADELVGSALGPSTEDDVEREREAAHAAPGFLEL